MLSSCKCNTIPLEHQGQATVETATFGSEFVAARIATDQLLTSGTHSCILEFQSDLKATCLETTNLWLTVQVFLHLPWHPITEPGKLLLQDSSNSTGKMENLNPADILSKH